MPRTPETTRAVQRSEPPQPVALTTTQVRDELEQIRPQLEQMLPKQMDPDRFLRVVTGALLRDPKILQCDRVSIFRAVLEAGQLGLEPTGLLGSAYIVPYRVKGVLQAQLIPGYRGLIDLARRSEQVEAIWAHTVRAKDDFSITLGSEPFVHHTPFIAPGGVDQSDAEAMAEANPGPFTGAYMIAVLRDRQGQPSIRQAEYMSIAEIEAVRKRSRASDGGPWVTDYSEMCRKTVVRRGAKYLPLTPDAVRGFSLDEIAEREADSVSPLRETPRSRLTRTLAERRGVEVQEEPQEAEGEVREVEGIETAPDGSDTPVRDVCGDTMPPPLGEGEVCVLPVGHEGAHIDEDGSRWPQTE